MNLTRPRLKLNSTPFIVQGNINHDHNYAEIEIIKVSKLLY